MHLTDTETTAFLGAYAAMTDHELYQHLEELTARAEVCGGLSGQACATFDTLRADLADVPDDRYLGTLAEALRMEPWAAEQVMEADQAVLAQSRVQMACQLRGVI